jgi:hypothetical protein
VNLLTFCTYLLHQPSKNSMFATDSQCPEGWTWVGWTNRLWNTRRDGGTHFKPFLAIVPFQHVEQNRTDLPQVQYRNRSNNSLGFKWFQVIWRDSSACSLQVICWSSRTACGKWGKDRALVTYGGLWCPVALCYWNRWWCSSSPTCPTYVPPRDRWTVWHCAINVILTISQEFTMFTSFFCIFSTKFW